MYKILITHELPGNYINDMKNKIDADILFYDGRKNIRQWLIENIKDADGILITLNDRIDEEIIDNASKLRVISTYSVGYDHIDVNYAKSKSIAVTNTPEVLTDATADLIFGIMMAVSRRIVEGNEIIKNNQWASEWNPYYMLGTEIHAKTLGIIGMGRIGRAILKRAEGFDMETIYYSKHKHDVNINYVDLNYLLKNSDFVIIALDLNNETYHFMDYDKIKLMKSDAYLINGTRGKIINERDLIKALNEKIIKGAALDVFENEPLDPDNPLIKMKNVVLTPHLGSATLETRSKMAEVAVKNLLNVLSGEEPLYKV